MKAMDYDQLTSQRTPPRERFAVMNDTPKKKSLPAPSQSRPLRTVASMNPNSSSKSDAISSLLSLQNSVASTIHQIRANDSTLRLVDWNFLNVGDTGAVALAQALPHNNSVREIRLHHNQIGNIGARAIAYSMEQNFHVLSVTGLAESNPRITDLHVVAQIKHLVRRNQHLEQQQQQQSNLYLDMNLEEPQDEPSSPPRKQQLHHQQLEQPPTPPPAEVSESKTSPRRLSFFDATFSPRRSESMQDLDGPNMPRRKEAPKRTTSEVVGLKKIGKGSHDHNNNNSIQSSSNNIIKNDTKEPKSGGRRPSIRAMIRTRSDRILSSLNMERRGRRNSRVLLRGCDEAPEMPSACASVGSEQSLGEQTMEGWEHQQQQQQADGGDTKMMSPNNRILWSLQSNDPVLTALHLEQVGIGDVELAHIGNALLNNSNVRVLRLVGNNITSKGTLALCKCLGWNKNNSVENLNLSCNPLGDDGAAVVAEFLQSQGSGSCLKSLWLQDIRMGNTGVSALANALRNNPPLEELNLQSNNIEPSGMVDLASALSKNNVLKMLNLHKNRIGDKGVVTLVKEGLMQNETSPLEQLVISGNDIGNDAAVALGAYIGWNPALRMLDLSVNRIGDAGLKVLSMGLTQNFRLSYLNLGENYISDSGVIALAKCLEMNSKLNSLCLYRNPHITRDGVVAIARALQHNQALLVLSGLPVHGVDPDVLSALRLLLERNRSLRKAVLPV